MKLEIDKNGFPILEFPFFISCKIRVLNLLLHYSFVQLIFKKIKVNYFF